MRIIALQILFVLLSALSIRAEVLTGSCGTCCTYSYDTETRVLTISGTGELELLPKEGLTKNYGAIVDKVVITYGITSIAASAIANLKAFSEITIPETVRSIGGKNFYSTKMTRLNIPSIGWWCGLELNGQYSIPFNNSNSPITSVFVDNGEGYSEITDIVIPQDCKEIKNYQFYRFRNIKSVDLANVQIVNPNAFSGCTALREVKANDKIAMYTGAFSTCTSLSEVRLYGNEMSTIYNSLPADNADLRIIVPQSILQNYLGEKSWASYKFQCLEDNAQSLSFVASADVEGDNLLYQNAGSWKCNSLVITDGQPFFAPVDFTATRATYDRGVGNVWGTLCLPFDVVASGDVSLYTHGEISNGVLTLTSTQTLLAGQPAIYNICSGKPLSFTVSDASIKANVAPATIESGIRLVGAFERTTVSDQNAYYVKSNQFWRCAEDGSFNVSPYRAYFTVANASSPSFSIAIDPNDPTAIDELLAGDEAPLGYYDTMGRRHAKPLKGLNVVKYRNGKSAKIQIM